MFRGHLLYSSLCHCLWSHHWAALGSVFFPPALQVFPYNDKMPLSLLPAEQSQISEPFQVLQTLRNVCGPSLHSLQHIQLSLWGAQMWAQDCSCDLTSAEWREGSLPFACWLCICTAWNATVTFVTGAPCCPKLTLVFIRASGLFRQSWLVLSIKFMHGMFPPYLGFLLVELELNDTLFSIYIICIHALK